MIGEIVNLCIDDLEIKAHTLKGDMFMHFLKESVFETCCKSVDAHMKHLPQLFSCNQCTVLNFQTPFFKTSVISSLASGGQNCHEICHGWICDIWCPNGPGFILNHKNRNPLGGS